MATFFWHHTICCSFFEESLGGESVKSYVRHFKTYSCAEGSCTMWRIGLSWIILTMVHYRANDLIRTYLILFVNVYHKTQVVQLRLVYSWVYQGTDKWIYSGDKPPANYSMDGTAQAFCEPQGVATNQLAHQFCWYQLRLLANNLCQLARLCLNRTAFRRRYVIP